MHGPRNNNNKKRYYGFINRVTVYTSRAVLLWCYDSKQLVMSAAQSGTDEKATQ
jgi:hypothetical protein